jgi:hypothetical protein
MLSLWGIISLSLMFHGGVGLVHVRGHTRAPENLTSLGYMTATELATYCVPEDPTSPAPVGGYVMVCVATTEESQIRDTDLRCAHRSSSQI